MSEKKCTKCGFVLPLTRFYTQGKNKIGLPIYNGACKDCKNRARQDYRYQNPDKYREEYNKRDAQKQRESVKRNKDKNKELNYIVGRVWMKANPEKVKEYDRNKRAKRRNCSGKHTQQEWLDLCEKHGYVCVCCGESKPLTVDHVIPIIKGGENSIDNIQPLCRSCNSRKKDKSIDYRKAGLALSATYH